MSIYDGKQRAGECFQGKSTEPLEYGGIKFLFPVAPALPDPADNILDELRSEIDRVGVRESISIVIPSEFDPAAHIMSDHDPPLALHLLGKRLVKQDSRSTSGQNSSESSPVPVVFVINGELRLRLAAEIAVPLGNIPFEHFDDPPATRDIDFKEKLSNESQRQQYEDLPQKKKRKYRFMMDLWKTSTTRRGGMSNTGYTEMMRVIDTIFDEEFEKLSNRKMADILGISHEQVRRLRTDAGSEELPPEDQEEMTQLKELQQQLHEINSAANRIAEGAEEVRRNSEDIEIVKADEDAHERHVDRIVGYYEDQLDKLDELEERAREQGYDEIVAGTIASLDPLFEDGKLVADALDDIHKDGTRDYTADDDFDDLIEIGPVGDKDETVEKAG